MQASISAAAVSRRTRNVSKRQISATSGTRMTRLKATIQRSAGKIVNRKLTVSVSTIMRSTKFAVIISTLYLSCERRTSTVIMVSDSAAATAGRRMAASQKKFRMPQVSRKAMIAVTDASVAIRMARAAR